MVETDKEYKWGVFANTLIEYIENLNQKSEDLCDCLDYYNHDEECRHILIKKDVEHFNKRVLELGAKNE